MDKEGNPPFMILPPTHPAQTVVKLKLGVRSDDKWSNMTEGTLFSLTVGTFSLPPKKKLRG